MNLSRLLAWGIALSTLAGCGEQVTTYAPLDASPWDARAASWQTGDAGASGYGFVSNSLGNSISVLDLSAQRTIATLPVGVIPLAENGPHHLAIDPRVSAIYTPLSMPAPAIPAGPHAAHGSSSRPGILIKRSLDDFRLLGRVDVEPNPGDIALSPDGHRAFVSHFDLLRAQMNPGNRDAQRSNLVVIDTRTMQRIYTIPVCVAAHGIALSPDGNTVYLACYGDDALGVVSFASEPPVVTLVPIRGELAPNPTSPTYAPYALTRSPDGATVWVACSPPNVMPGARGLFIAFDTATRRFDTARSTSSLIGTPFFGVYSPDGNTMVIPLQNRDAIARVTTGPTFRVMDQVPLNASDCMLPHQINLGPDGLYYLVCEGRHNAVTQDPSVVLSLRPDDLSIVARYAVSAFPDSIVFMGGAR